MRRKSDINVNTMMPGEEGVPLMVCVLPAPVAP
jgi:hypothetical protein